MTSALDVRRSLLVMLLADARLPVAGHTQSGGLEPAVLDGLVAAEVPAFITSRLTTVTRVEAGTAVVARGLAASGPDLEQVVAHWAARTPSPAMRAAARLQARGLERLSRRLWPDLLAVPANSPRSLVLGVLAAQLDLEAEEVATLVAYDDVQAVTSAALKLLPMDPAVATGWALAASGEIEALVRAVRGLRTPEEIPACGAPQIEWWAQFHALTTRRLFHA